MSSATSAEKPRLPLTGMPPSLLSVPAGISLLHSLDRPQTYNKHHLAPKIIPKQQQLYKCIHRYTIRLCIQRTLPSISRFPSLGHSTHHDPIFIYVFIFLVLFSILTSLNFSFSFFFSLSSRRKLSVCAYS